MKPVLHPVIAITLYVAFSQLAVAQRPQALELNQRVAVVVASYPGDSIEPPVTVETLSDSLNRIVNAYYREASLHSDNRQSQTSFQFVAIPGVCEFSYTYDETAPGGRVALESIPFWDAYSAEDDPLVMFREFPDAIRFADSIVPNIFDNTFRVVLFIDRAKRGRSSQGYLMPPVMMEDGRVILVSTSIQDSADMVDVGFETIKHELGHHLGLPDLYTEPTFSGPDAPENVGPWCEMASNRSQHFCAYSRHRIGYMPTTRVIEITPGTTPNVDQIITLGLPHNANGLPELIKLKTSEQLAQTGTPIDAFMNLVRTTDLIPYSGFYIEARDPGIGLDTAINDNYEPGIIISSIVPEPLQLIPGIRPMLIRPREAMDDPEDLSRAAFQPDNPATAADESTFTDDETGITIQVLRRNGNGSFDVRVRWIDPPRPDIETSDILFDSPTNTFGVTEVPPLYGDRIAAQLDLDWHCETGPFGVCIPVPDVSLTPFNHQINIRATNIGGATATNVTAHVMTLAPTFPAFNDFTDFEAVINSLSPLRTSEIMDVNLGDIAPGQTVMQIIPFTPDLGPFVAVYWIDRSNRELIYNLANNLRIEPFILPNFTTASPYQEQEFTFNLINFSDDPVFVYGSPLGLPEDLMRWEIETQNEKQILKNGESAQYQLTIRPKDIGKNKPGQPLPLTVAGFMGYGDTYYPIGEQTIQAQLKVRSQILLKTDPDHCVAQKPIRIEGALRSARAEDNYQGIPGEPVRITFSVSDSMAHATNQIADVITDANGNFEFVFNGMEKGKFYAAAAEFAGSGIYAQTTSNTLRFECFDIDNTCPYRIKSFTTQKKGDQWYGYITINRPATHPVQISLNASPQNSIDILNTITVPAGRSSIAFNIKPAHLPVPGLIKQKIKIKATICKQSKTILLKNLTD